MTFTSLLAEAGLTGRGGAAFSTATKVAAAHAHGARLVVNACDGELGAAKDTWVVEHRLAELVDGAALVADGAPVTYAAHRGSETARRLAGAGLRVLAVPPRYVSSEESALISLAQGGLARPLTKRQPFVRGGRDSEGRRVSPTVVLNAETVWRAAQVARNGPAWFRSFGTPDQPGPRLVAVSTPSVRGVVVETAAGAPLGDLLDLAGGLPDGSPAVLVGGLGGTFVAAAHVAGLRWSDADLAGVGARTGPGVVEALDPRDCPLEFVDRCLTWAAGESAGQCGPCMFGLPALATDWRALVAGGDRTAYDRVVSRVGLLPGRGACRFPDGVAGFAGSALRVFADHLEQHRAGRCPAAELRTAPRGTDVHAH
ncbi:formate dehydrogenase [Terrabacter sp. Soil811]|uniref:NADH-ubiquinone oxidoreductase-F iron-sulfur binding region domain-containing protein n=1 Tax=Terrabacter sp. Soil811 TaxID=1736419 RepID=UPI0006F7C029|nr:NADH-ubiquinone oxidoreductase-F iron-sulfur binding region domain-containing protein [Terrabacter sp. Soil811]KRF39970.1 formate dehydrogenase [Terrabacter sp. Soil811]